MSRVLLAFAVCSVLAAAPVIADSRPNIVLIMADDLGYGHLGCYGQQRIRTPHLDQMAAEGMRFTQCYAGAPSCAPSRCVLMTGLHGGHTTVRSNAGGVPLPDGALTVAEVLHDAGYATGLFGKWGLGEHGTEGVPYKQGFDEFFGYLHQVHAHFYYPEYLWKNDERVMLAGNANGGQENYTHDVIVKEALDFVRRKKDRRFFLYLPLTLPHYELLVPEDSLREYRGKFPETPYTGRGRPTGYPSDYAAQETPKAALAAMITRMDAGVGELLDLLEKFEIDDNTLVIFTSDNGPSPGAADPEFFDANGPLRGHKFELYEGGIRVPAIARWPGHVPAGATNDRICYFADVLPTFATLAEAEVPPGLDGISMTPALLDHKPVSAHRQHEFLYWEHDDAAHRAVRSGDWKALSIDGAFELYDLANDPGEQHNVAEQNPQIAGRMRSLLESAHRDPPPQIEPEKPPGRRFQ